MCVCLCCVCMSIWWYKGHRTWNKFKRPDTESPGNALRCQLCPLFMILCPIHIWQWTWTHSIPLFMWTILREDAKRVILHSPSIVHQTRDKMTTGHTFSMVPTTFSLPSFSIQWSMNRWLFFLSLSATFTLLSISFSVLKQLKLKDELFLSISRILVPLLDTLRTRLAGKDCDNNDPLMSGIRRERERRGWVGR